MLKLGVNVGYSGRQIELPIEQIREAEAMGCDSVWTAEAYGSDALTPLAWIGAATSRKQPGSASSVRSGANTPGSA